MVMDLDPSLYQPAYFKPAKVSMLTKFFFDCTSACPTLSPWTPWWLLHHTGIPVGSESATSGKLPKCYLICCSMVQMILLPNMSNPKLDLQSETLIDHRVIHLLWGIQKPGTWKEQYPRVHMPSLNIGQDVETVVPSHLYVALPSLCDVGVNIMVPVRATAHHGAYWHLDSRLKSVMIIKSKCFDGVFKKSLFCASFPVITLVLKYKCASS